MQFASRIHDALDLGAVISGLLPALANTARGRRAAYAEYDAARRLLVHRWACDGEQPLEDGAINLDPVRLHALLPDDVAGDRPFRAADDVPAWAVMDMLPNIQADKYDIAVRAVAAEGEWLGVLLVATPRGWFGGRGEDDALQSAGDMLEIAVARVHIRKSLLEAESQHRTTLEAMNRKFAERLEQLEGEVAQARNTLAHSSPKLNAMEGAATRATEMLMEAHEELAMRTDRMRRQGRVIYLLRKVMERHSHGAAPRELAQDLVQLVAETFGGGRCSLLLIDPHRHGGEMLRVAAALGLPAAVDAHRLQVPVGQGIAGWVARNRAPVVVRDEEEATYYPLLADSDFTTAAFVSLPLTCRGHFQGVLNVTNFRDGTIDNLDVEQLRLVSLCIALVVDHARLSELLFELEVH